MENKSHALAAGAFVIFVVALLLGLAFLLSRDNGSYHTYEMSTRSGIGGLQPQATVRYRGVAVGKVTQIGFDPQVGGNVLIRIAVDDQAPLTNATFATLGYQGVTGLAYVLLDDASEPLPKLEPGSSGLPRLQLRASQLSQLADQMPNTMAQVDVVVQRINKLLAEDNQKAVTEALNNISRAAGGIAALTQRMDSALAGVPGLASEAGRTLQTLQGAAAGVNGMSTEITAATRRLNEQGGALDHLAQGTQALARATDTFATTTLPRINRATDDASQAARQLSRTASGISDNPQSLVYGNGAVPPGPGEPGFTAPAAHAAP